MKRFKIFDKQHIELRFDVTKDENFDIFLKLLNLFELTIQTTICTCSYDRELINLDICNGVVNVEVNKTEKKFFRTIHLKDIEVIIDTIEVLKKVLQISRDYDAILTFSSINKFNTSTIAVVNDNGQNYINFDKKKYDVKETEKKICQILNG